MIVKTSESIRHRATTSGCDGALSRRTLPRRVDGQPIVKVRHRYAPGAAGSGRAQGFATNRSPQRLRMTVRPLRGIGDREQRWRVGDRGVVLVEAEQLTELSDVLGVKLRQNAAPELAHASSTFDRGDMGAKPRLITNHSARERRQA